MDLMWDPTQPISNEHQGIFSGLKEQEHKSKTSPLSANIKKTWKYTSFYLLNFLYCFIYQITDEVIIFYGVYTIFHSNCCFGDDDDDDDDDNDKNNNNSILF